MFALAETNVATSAPWGGPGATYLGSKGAIYSEWCQSEDEIHISTPGISLTFKDGNFTATSVQTAKVDNLAPEMTQRDKIVAQLLRFKELDYNWDGSGAEKADQYSLDRARKFIRLLSPDSELPRPTLHADGHAMLFINRPDLYLELEFLEGDVISYYARRGSQEWNNEAYFDGSKISSELEQIGFRTY